MLYNLKAAYLTKEQKQAELRNGGFRECIAPPLEVNQEATELEEDLLLRVHLMIEHFCLKDEEAATLETELE